MIVTKEGALASFYTVNKAPIKHLRVYFSPKQSGSGDPSPENIRPIEGWDAVEVNNSQENLFIPASFIRSSNGITFTYYTNGDIHVEGTATANTWLNVPSSMYFTITPGEYTISGNKIDSNVSVYLVVSKENGGDIKFYTSGNMPNTKFIDFTDNEARIQIAVSNGKTVNVTIHPKLEHGSYTANITTEYEFGVLGKNKFDKDAVINNSWIRAGDLSEENPLGSIKENASGYTLSSYIPVYPNTIYTIKYNVSSLATAAGMVFFSEQNINSAISGISLYYQTYVNPSTTREYYTFTTPNNCNYLRISTPPNCSNVQLELGSTATAYEPYNPNYIVYGGYVDLITGEVVQKYDYVNLGTNPWNLLNSDLHVFNTHPGGTMRRKLENNINYISDIYTAVPASLISTEMPNYSIKGHSTVDYSIFVRDTRASTVLELQSLLKDKYLYYELSEPITYQLAPQQLETFIGQNNIWSNADRVEVEYELAESNDELYRRRNILLQNAPHLKTIQSGNTEDSAIIAHFEAVGEPLTQLTLALPYNSEGYQSATITAAGVNLIGQDMINGLSYGVQFTRYFNSEGLLEYVTAEGTTTSTNTFRNYNYVKNEQRWILGRTATCCYSDAGYFPMVANNDTPRTIEGWVTSRITEDGWRRYDVYDYTSTQSSAWYRFQIISPVEGTEVSTRLYPLVCLAQDMYCDYDPYRGVDYTVTLPETFYGGEVDLITGYGISEYAADGTRLSLPNTFSITPQSVNTLLGINNIWSNQGLVTVKYWTH